MKLSEAIVLGSIGTEQAFGQYKTESGATCAWGAAYTAAGIDFDSNFGLSLQSPSQKWPIANHRAECPHCDVSHGSMQVGHVIAHLNDFHKWPRPQIAAWVATIEPQEEPVQEPVQAACEECHAQSHA